MPFPAIHLERRGNPQEMVDCYLFIPKGDPFFLVLTTAAVTIQKLSAQWLMSVQTKKISTDCWFKEIRIAIHDCMLRHRILRGLNTLSCKATR